MRFNKRLLAGLGVIALLALILGGVLVLSGNPVAASTIQADSDQGEDDREGPDTPITGDNLERASKAALDYLGEGRVTGTEVGDEEGYYEIEVRLDSGGQVDVHLDQEFNVLGQEGDGTEVED